MVRIGMLVLLAMLSSSFAIIIESGDGGKQFASDLSSDKCQEGNVQAVYLCLGNVVRVVSSAEGEGSTFFKPDGSIVRCPVVAPSEMGAECLQMMTPNYCPGESVCGTLPEPQIFPGNENSAEQQGDFDYYIHDDEPAVIAELDEHPDTVTPEKEYSASDLPKTELVPPAVKANPDFLLPGLAFVIIMLGVGSIAVLFLMFKQSISE